jgi:hypothetical protein
MRYGIRICLLMIAALVSFQAIAACRAFHYDHDGNHQTPQRLKVACEKTHEVRTIPRYRIPRIDGFTPQTRIRDPQHVALPRTRPKCHIPSVYHFTMMQKLSVCMTTR